MFPLFKGLLSPSPLRPRTEGLGFRWVDVEALTCLRPTLPEGSPPAGAWCVCVPVAATAPLSLETCSSQPPSSPANLSSASPHLPGPRGHQDAPLRTRCPSPMDSAIEGKIRSPALHTAPSTSLGHGPAMSVVLVLERKIPQTGSHTVARAFLCRLAWDPRVSRLLSARIASMRHHTQPGTCSFKMFTLGGGGAHL